MKIFYHISKFSSIKTKLKRNFCTIEFKDHYPVMHREIIEIIKKNLQSFSLAFSIDYRT